MCETKQRSHHASTVRTCRGGQPNGGSQYLHGGVYAIRGYGSGNKRVEMFLSHAAKLFRVFRRWWPETGLNRRRRPFQGRAGSSSFFSIAILADFAKPKSHQCRKNLKYGNSSLRKNDLVWSCSTKCSGFSRSPILKFSLSVDDVGEYSCVRDVRCCDWSHRPRGGSADNLNLGSSE